MKRSMRRSASSIFSYAVAYEQRTKPSPHWPKALPGTTATWGGITVNGGPGSLETRLTYAHLEGYGSTAVHSSAGTLVLDHVTFGSTDHQYLSLDGSSFLVQDCLFPAPTAGARQPTN